MDTERSQPSGTCIHQSSIRSEVLLSLTSEKSEKILRVWLMDGPVLSPSVWCTEMRFWQRKPYSHLIRVQIQPGKLKGNQSDKPVSVAELRKNTALRCANLSLWGGGTELSVPYYFPVKCQSSLHTAVLISPRDSPVHECTFQLYTFALNSIITQSLTQKFCFH